MAQLRYLLCLALLLQLLSRCSTIPFEKELFGPNVDDANQGESDRDTWDDVISPVSQRSIEKRTLVSDQNIMAIFTEIYQETRSGLTNIVNLVERYGGFMVDVRIDCTGGSAAACDTVTVMRQLTILKGMVQQVIYNKVRSLLAFKELDMTKYLEQLKLSRDFRNLLTNVRFDLSTSISVTQDVGARLSSYFSGIASYDKGIGKADMAYVTGKLEELKKGSERLWDETISISFDTILKGAVVILSAEVAERTAAVAFAVMGCFNPLAIAAGNCDLTEIIDRMRDLMTAIRNLASAGRLLDGLSKLKAEAESMQTKFAENQAQLVDIRNLINTFVNATDEEKKTMATDFIDKYGGYTPAVTDQDLARLAAALEYTASAGCDLIAGAGGVSGNIGGTVLDNAFGNCGEMGVHLAELESFYEEMFTFQFELVDAFTAIVRSDIAIAHSNAITSTTQLELRPMVIALLMDEIKIQNAARTICNGHEYAAAGSRPALCKTNFFTDGALQLLISYEPLLSSSKIIHYAYIPSKPSETLEDKSFIDIDKLISGEYVYFRPPYQDTEWLKTYNWVPEDYDLETGFYVERMDMYIPGIKCTDGSEQSVSVSVQVSSQTNVRVHASSLLPSYLLPIKALSFMYEENSGYCQPCSEILFPIKDNSNPGVIRNQTNICVKSQGLVSQCQSVRYASLFTTWKIRLVSGSCPLMRDPNLGFEPMVTVSLTKVEVKAATDECWPPPCQYGGTCIDGLMNFTCDCRSPMTGAVCNEVISGYEGSSPDACDMTTNIALNRPSQESTLYYFLGQHVYLRAAAANDLDTGTNLEKCSHTQQEYQPFWYVELPLTHKVCAVRITNRADSGSAASRLANATVVISDRRPDLPNRVETYCATVKSNPGNGEVMNLTCENPIPASKGRFLTVYLPGTQYLHFCNIEAFTTRGTSPAFSSPPPTWKVCNWETNIARNNGLIKTLTQSTNYHSYYGRAGEARDGRYTTDNWQQCSHTAMEDKPWWAIEFHNPVELCGAKILQMGSSSASRSAYAKVGTLDNIPYVGMAAEMVNFKLCGSLPATIREGDINYVQCEVFPVRGTTVVVYSPSMTYLNLCEVELYAVSN